MAQQEPRDLMDVLNRLEGWRELPAEDPSRQYRRFMIRGDAYLEPIDAVPLENLKPERVILRDISRAGIGILTERKLSAGSNWRLRFQSEQYQLGSQVIVVRFCRMIQAGLYLVGTQLAFEPVMMHLLGVPSDMLLRSEQAENAVESEEAAPGLADYLAPR